MTGLEYLAAVRYLKVVQILFKSEKGDTAGAQWLRGRTLRSSMSHVRKPKSSSAARCVREKARRETGTLPAMLAKRPPVLGLHTRMLPPCAEMTLLSSITTHDVCEKPAGCESVPDQFKRSAICVGCSATTTHGNTTVGKCEKPVVCGLVQARCDLRVAHMESQCRCKYLFNGSLSSRETQYSLLCVRSNNHVICWINPSYKYFIY